MAKKILGGFSVWWVLFWVVWLYVFGLLFVDAFGRGVPAGSHSANNCLCRWVGRSGCVVSNGLYFGDFAYWVVDLYNGEGSSVELSWTNSAWETNVLLRALITTETGISLVCSNGAYPGLKIHYVVTAPDGGVSEGDYCFRNCCTNCVTVEDGLGYFVSSVGGVWDARLTATEWRSIAGPGLVWFSSGNCDWSCWSAVTNQFLCDDLSEVTNCDICYGNDMDCYQIYTNFIHHVSYGDGLFVERQPIYNSSCRGVNTEFCP